MRHQEGAASSVRSHDAIPEDTSDSQREVQTGRELATCVDELSGESMNARNRLKGIERRVGMEGQQQQATMRDLQASIDQCREDIQGLIRCSAECQMDIKSRDTKHFEMEELIFKFSVDLEEGLKESREGLQKLRHLPESGPVSTSDHQEHMKAVQQVLDECRAQLVTHEKKLQDGERHMR